MENRRYGFVVYDFILLVIFIIIKVVQKLCSKRVSDASKDKYLQFSGGHSMSPCVVYIILHASN